MKNRLTKILDSKRFKLVLLLEGLIVGIASGFIIVGYRVCLSQGALWLNKILTFCKESIFTIALWFVILIILAKIVSKLVTFEPLISGSGIPQLEGELC